MVAGSSRFPPNAWHAVLYETIGPPAGPAIEPPAAVPLPAVVAAGAPQPILPHPDRRQHRAVRIRPVAKPQVSLVDRWLATGRAVVRPGGNRSLRYQRTKRLIDIVGALALLVLLAPLMLVTFLALAVTTRSRPIFRQRRLGHCGRPFTMYKFRTMTRGAEAWQDEVPNEQDGPIFKNRRDPRITRIGRLLRSTSIDETPQLINVLLGQMSLVGPRPPLGREVARYKAWQRRRLGVKPGLTCLWQVSGRSEIGFEDWVRMDLWYVRHQGLWADLVLLMRTPLSVLSRRGAY